jgi:hypothetical protein
MATESSCKPWSIREQHCVDVQIAVADEGRRMCTQQSLADARRSAEMVVVGFRYEICDSSCISRAYQGLGPGDGHHPSKAPYLHRD